MLVDPFAGDRLEDNLTPVGRIYYVASTMICTPASFDQQVGLALGAQAGEARLRKVAEEAGFTRFRRATETLFNLILEARIQGRSSSWPAASRPIKQDREQHHDRIQCRAFRVKPGREQNFLDAHKTVGQDWPGLRHANIIKTGERTYCIIAEWTDMAALATARASMIATLDAFRDTLEDLGGGLGLTDPVSGEVVLALK